MNILLFELAALRAAGPLTFAIICLMIAYYDFKYYVIPNELVLAGIAIRFLWPFNLARAFLIAILFTGILIVFSVLIWIITKKRIGIGDFKLMFMLSLFADLEQNIMGLFIALLTTGIVLFIKKEKIIAFAPFLVFGWGMQFFYNVVK